MSFPRYRKKTIQNILTIPSKITEIAEGVVSLHFYLIAFVILRMTKEKRVKRTNASFGFPNESIVATT